MKKILLCSLLLLLFNILIPQAAFSHPYDEPSKSQTVSTGD